MEAMSTRKKSQFPQWVDAETPQGQAEVPNFHMAGPKPPGHQDIKLSGCLGEWMPGQCQQPHQWNVPKVSDPVERTEVT